MSRRNSFKQRTFFVKNIINAENKNIKNIAA